MLSIEALENTPRHLRADPRYSEDKRIRDQAWDDWRASHPEAAEAFPIEMQQVIDEGYAARLAAGDTRAASLFARLVAFRMNSQGRTDKPGWLKKGGGNNVDGYSVDAIVLNANPNDLFNVIDLVRAAEAPSASPQWNGPLPRRTIDVWDAPRQLSTADLTYLKPVGPGPPPPPPPPPLKSRAQFATEFSTVNAFYGNQAGLQRVGGMVSGVDASVFAILRKKADGESIDDLAVRNACRAVLQLQCDVQSMIQWGYDLMAGNTDAQVIKAIRQSDEWKAKHPGETP
jgi:hypothetical protein